VLIKYFLALPSIYPEIVLHFEVDRGSRKSFAAGLLRDRQ
jgi:hypothetical protein